MEEWTYDEAKAVATSAVKYDMLLPAGAAQKLLDKIKELEDSRVPNGGFDAVSVYLEAWKAAREQFGVDGDEDDPEDKQFHYAECDRVQGPYVCTCDDAGQDALAYGLAIDYIRKHNGRGRTGA